MENIIEMLMEIKAGMDEMSAKIEEIESKLDSLSDDVSSLMGVADEPHCTDDITLEDLSSMIEDLSNEIEALRGCGPDDSITDISNKLSVIIKGAGYEDTTLGFGSKVIVGDGDDAKEAIITKYDGDGVELEYL